MNEPNVLRLGIVADAHVAPAAAEPYAWQNLVDLPHSIELLEAGLDWLAAHQIDALVLLGDLTEAADTASFALVRERAMGLGVPVLAVPGNCDVDAIDRSLDRFDAISGGPFVTAPEIRDFAHGVAVELIDLEGNAGSPALRGVRASGAALPRPETHLVLTHYPMLDLEPDLLAAGFRYSGNLTNRAHLEMVLRDAGVPVVVIHGHLHIHDARVSGSLLHLSCGALIEPPHLVSIVEIAPAEAGVTVRRLSHSVRADTVEHLPVFTPLRQAWHWDGAEWIGAADLR